MPQVTLVICPLIPNRDAVLFQVGDIGRALQKPDQFVNDRLQVQLFCGDHREAFPQVKAHLIAEYRPRTCTGAVGFFGAMVEHMAHEVEVLTHDR